MTPIIFPQDRAVVFVDDRPAAALAVSEFVCEGRLFRRSATLTSVTVEPASLQGQTVTLVVPQPLADGTTAWQVLLRGRAQVRHERDNAAQRERTWQVIDEVSHALEQQPTAIQAEALDTPTSLHQTIRQLLRLAEASTETIGEVSTLGVDEAEAVSSVLGKTLAERLEALLAPRRLRLQVDERFDGQRLHRTVRVVPEDLGRRVRLRWDREVVEMQSTGEASGAAVLVGSAEPTRVELTAELHPAWDASLENRPDADYRTDLSDADPLVADVFRLWLLNENAALPGATPFDLAALFADDRVVPRPIPFGNCLTVDAAGQPRLPIVELSTDAGLTWRGITHDSAVLLDRAGVRLVAPELPADLITAARLGNARLRVTASLTSPRRTDRVRHIGNPFLGHAVTVTHRFDDLRHHRLDPSSIHFDAVSQGELAADLHDDRAVLDQRLRRLAENTPPVTRATLTLAGCDAMLTPSSRLLNAGGPDRTLRNQPQSITREAAVVERVAVDYVNAKTRVHVS